MQKQLVNHARMRMTALAEKFEVIGDVRGSGLIFGAETGARP